MMRAVVIGATGHIGTFLVPRLVALGWDVTAVSRGRARPYRQDPRWERVEQVTLDRDDPDFGRRIAEARPDAVVDLICFTEAANLALADALAALENPPHLVHVGSIWTHGPAGPARAAGPVPEDAEREPVGEYGIAKLAIERALITATVAGGMRASVVHPGHIVGPGWWPLNPAGHFDPEVFRRLAAGRPLTLPNLGLETVHHVHADDVAALIEAVLAQPGRSVGEAFHAVSPQALTLRAYAEGICDWFGHPPRLSFAPYADWARDQRPENAEAAWEHLSRSPSCSMAKARRLLGYEPGFDSLAAVQDSLRWQAEHGALDLTQAPIGSPARDAP